MTKKIRIGQKGEEIASNYLKNKGYEIITRNYRKKFGEIDIIGRSPDSILVFVEVKTLFSAKHVKHENFLNPEDNFTTQKSIKVKRTCEFFTSKYPELIDDEKGWRVDLIAIEISDESDGEEPIIRHYENV
jgi:putative endonuclease